MQPATSTTCPAPKSPADQLKDLSVILRSDLHVSRQLHQGQPVYVVHDPISFRTHRLTLQNYQVLVRLDPSKTIGQNFQTLVRQRHFSTSDQDFYYQYIMQLHQLGLIVLPVANGGRLFEQHQKQSKLKRRSKIYGALFMQIPLARPDLFLTRTAPQMRVLFSRGFLTLWAVAGLFALWLVGSRFDEFMKPLNSLLATENLPFLWGAFVVLKIWHELGHGYACKIHGGAVPEMGMLLIAGTPAAYVDATAAWSFSERWKRLVVMLGGMYFETIVAIPAVFIWAFSSSPMLSSCAYQLVMMASLITVLFNANPLMKYDGYFIAGELLGIQNLRGRSDQWIKDALKRVSLGLPGNVALTSTRERWILPIYGVAASIYKTLLIIGIAVMISLRFPLVGLAIAGFQLATTIGTSAWKLGIYLLTSPETAPVRMRATIVAVLVLVALPISTFFVPMPFGIVASGVVAVENEHYLNADTSGAFVSVSVDAGDHVDDHQPIATLENHDVLDRHRTTQASLQEALLQWEVAHNRDLVKAAQFEPKIRELKYELIESQRRVASLELAATEPGIVARVLPKSQHGRYVQTGETVAIIVSGRPILRTWLSEDQLGSLDREPGSTVEFRIPGRSGQTYSGRSMKIEPASEKSSLSNALTFVAGGEIVLDPQTGLPIAPLFQVDVEPDDESVLAISEHGMRVSLNLPRRRESIASWALNRIRRFVNKTLMA